MLGYTFAPDLFSMPTHPHKQTLIADQTLSVVEVNPPSIRSIPTQSILTARDVEKNIAAETTNQNLEREIQVCLNFAHRGIVGASIDALICNIQIGTWCVRGVA